MPGVPLFTGVGAAAYPTFQGGLLAVVVIWILALICWASWIAADGRYRRPRQRMRYTIAVFESFALFGCIVVWRARGGGAVTGLVVAALLIACAFGSFVLRRRLYPLVAGGGGLSAAGAGVVAATGMAGSVFFRADPVWFSRNFLLPVMLLIAAIVPPYWAGAEQIE